MHTSVFLKEAVDVLEVKKDGKYIDATYGQGGHSREIVDRGGEVLGIDADPEQVQKSEGMNVVQGNFADIESLAKKEDYFPVDGVLFDFGLSMEQIKSSGRGFTYQNDDEPLDMRLRQEGETVADFLDSAPEAEISEILMKYSEDLNSAKIAEYIVTTRSHHPVKTVGDLKKIINTVLSESRRGNARDTYARVFQALRIYVNDELERIKQGIQGALNIVQLDGKIVFITFHSLEDRVVKAFVRSLKPTVTQKRIDVHKERKLAKFERSATLRVITKIK